MNFWRNWPVILKKLHSAALGRQRLTPYSVRLNISATNMKRILKKNAARQEYAKNLPTIRLLINARAADFARASARRQCPVQAISGQPRSQHVIDTTKCIKCGACMAACPFKAIVKG